MLLRVIELIIISILLKNITNQHYQTELCCMLKRKIKMLLILNDLISF